MVRIKFEDEHGNKATGKIELITDDALVDDLVTAIQALTCAKVTTANVQDWISYAGSLTAADYDAITAHIKSKLYRVALTGKQNFSYIVPTPKATDIEDAGKGEGYKRWKSAKGDAFVAAIKALTGSDLDHVYVSGVFGTEKGML